MKRKWLKALCMVVAISVLAGCGTAPTGELSAEQESVRKRAAVHLQLAIGYYSRGQLDTAQEEIRRAVRIDGDYADAYNVQGLIQMAQGQNRLAEDSFQRALRLTPGNPEVLNNYGWFLCQNGREKESIQQFEEAVRNQGMAPAARIYNNAGICSLKLQDAARAERYFIKAFEQDPADPSVNTSLAEVYYRRGQLDRAQFHINRALKTEQWTAAMLWLAVRIERKIGDLSVAGSHATQLRRRYPNSPEYAAYMRGAFDE